MYFLIEDNALLEQYNTIRDNPYLKKLLYTNEMVAQIFRGMMTGQYCFILFYALKPQYNS